MVENQAESAFVIQQPTMPQRDDVGVVETFEGGGLPVKELPLDGVRVVGVQDFDGNRGVVGCQIPGAMDDAHPTSADLLSNPVAVGDGLP